MKTKNYYRPKFKIIKKLKIVNLANLKILKFKKKTWLNFLFLFKNLSKKTKYKRFKIVDPRKILINKKNMFELNFKNYFKKLFFDSKIFNIFFGKLKKKYFKKLTLMYFKKLKTKKLFSKKNFILKTLKKRIDFVLFISKFSLSLRSARNSIISGYVKVNKKITKHPSFLLKTGDVLTLKNTYNGYKNNLARSIKWPVIPDYLLVNYKTMQIIYFNNNSSSVNNFFYSDLKFPKNL